MIYKSATDASFLTDYSSNCLADKKIMKDNKITNQFEYRKFLQENAKKIMEANKNKLNNKKM